MSNQSRWLTVLILLGGSVSAVAQEKVIGPVRVKIQDEKPAFFEPLLPVDPARRVEYQSQGNMAIRVTVENRMLHLGFMYALLKIDNVIQGVNRVEVQNAHLPKTPSGKERDGFYSIYSLNRIRITSSVEVVPTKTPGGKQRRRDAVLIRYTIENKDTVPHKIGLRQGMDVYVLNNDGALFAAPNQPGKILDGVELRDKMVPDYLQMLERPNLQDPGFVGYLTFNLGSGVEKPNRVILTSLGAGAPDNWNLQAIPANGDSAMSINWDPVEVKAGGKREIAFAIGGGVAGKIENEGQVKLDLGGSFEPGKLFTISAFISDPAQGQSLTLELPAGMERIEGTETQPAPAVDGDGNCLVQWRARVQRPGSFTLRVHSSTGVTLTRQISITPVDGK